MFKTSKNGNVSLLGSYFLAVLVLFISFNATASVIAPVTYITKDTIWKSDTVKIFNDIVVSEKATLTINPKVVVEFEGYYNVTVLGAIQALGTTTDSICFKTKKGLENIGWRGIKFIGNTTLSSILNYCSFTNGYGSAGGAVYAEDVSFIKIDHCFFSSNKSEKGGALYIDNSGISLNNCRILNNNSTGEGGGIYVVSSNSASLANNIIYNNSAVKYGGGIYSELSKTLIKSNKIYNNICSGDSKGVYGGGGIASNYGADTIVNNLIYNNETNIGGGGLFYLSANGICLNNTVCNNKANDGGGVSVTESAVVFYNNIIWNNLSISSVVNSHNIYIKSTQTSVFTNCLVNNSPNYFLDTEKKTIFNGIINTDPLFFKSFTEVGVSSNVADAIWLVSNKSAALGAGIINNSTPKTDYDGNPRLTDGKIDIGAYEYQEEQNYSGLYQNDIYWYGRVNIKGDITIASNTRLFIFRGALVNVTGPFRITIQGQLLANGDPSNTILFSREVSKLNKVTNTPDEGWKGVRFMDNLNGATSSIVHCVFEYCNNNSLIGYTGGAISCSRFTKLNVKNSVFRYCAASKGGAIYLGYTSDVNVVNSLFYGNYAVEGAVFYLDNSNPKIFNCTTYNNEAETGGGFFCSNASPVIDNSILWKNSAKKGAQLYLNDVNSDPEILYSVVEKDLNGIEGPGSGVNYTGKYLNNIDENPLFNEPDKLNQFSLKSQSPCINSGNPGITPNMVGTTDIGGNSRFVKTIDIGAYEFQSISRISPIPDMSIIANSGLNALDLSEYFTTGAIYDTLKYKISSASDINTVSVLITASQLQIIPKQNITGTDTLIINVESVLGATITDTFLVKVNYLEIPLTSPVNNYRFKLDEEQAFSWPTLSTDLIKGYRLKIVEVINGQSVNDALQLNPDWYIDTVKNITASNISMVVNKKFPAYAKLVWQVYALNDEGDNLGISEALVFFGSPMLNVFYAGSNVVNVDTTIIHTISNLTGKGNINIPGKGIISFYFNNLGLRFADNAYYLENGRISLGYSDEQTITPVYLPNGDVVVQIDSLYITNAGFMVRCKAKWNIPVARDIVCEPEPTLLSYSNFIPAGVLKINALNFKLNNLPDAIMEFDNQSSFKIYDNSTYIPSLNGTIKAPVDMAQFLNDSILFGFSGVSTLDYFQSSVLNQRMVELNSLIHIIPARFTVDLSDSKSPDSSMPLDWKGIWAEQFRVTFVDEGIEYPMELVSSDGLLVNSKINSKAYFSYSEDGLEIGLDTLFQTPVATRFDGFYGNLKSIRITRPFSIGLSDGFTGSMIIPYIDETFEHNYDVTFNGMNYQPIMQPQIPDFSLFPANEKLIEQMVIKHKNTKYTGVIDKAKQTIDFTIPDTIDISNISAYFIVRGCKVTLETLNQVRDVSLVNFTNPCIYRVFAGDDTYVDYSVAVKRIVTDIIEPQNEIFIGPNPANDYLKVATNNSIGLKAFIYNTYGKCLLSMELTSADNIIQIHSIPSGLYILKLEDSNNVYSVRFIKN